MRKRVERGGLRQDQDGTYCNMCHPYLMLVTFQLTHLDRPKRILTHIYDGQPCFVFNKMSQTSFDVGKSTLTHKHLYRSF